MRARKNNCMHEMLAGRKKNMFWYFCMAEPHIGISYSQFTIDMVNSMHDVPIYLQKAVQRRTLLSSIYFNSINAIWNTFGDNDHWMENEILFAADVFLKKKKNADKCWDLIKSKWCATDRDFMVKRWTGFFITSFGIQPGSIHQILLFRYSYRHC